MPVARPAVQPVAVWKDLCIDALDPVASAAFWGPVTGLEPGRRRGAVGPLEGFSPQHRIWVNPVDRPHEVKNRVHLDVYTRSVDDLVARGARVLAPAAETGLGWTVMADPEGNEFCAFVREEPPAYRLHGIGVDCVDPERMAAWWGGTFGVEVTTYDGHDDLWTLEHAAVDDRMTLDFAPVPEPRTVPNRVHWDVVGDVDAVLARGATHLWGGESWQALADPEGNEFCVFAPQPG